MKNTCKLINKVSVGPTWIRVKYFFSRTLLRYVRLMAWAVRLSSVICRLSVTLIHPRYRLELFGNIFAPSNSLGTLTVCVTNLNKNLKGFWGTGNTRGYEKLAFFDQYLALLIALLLSLRIGIPGIVPSFLQSWYCFLRKAYTVYVRPILEYASSVWSPHFIKYINSIENVQWHFTKRISSTELPYLERLAVMDLEVEPLELRRIKTDLTMYLKIYNNLSALPSDYLPCDNSVRTYHSRRKCEYIIPPFCLIQLL